MSAGHHYLRNSMSGDPLISLDTRGPTAPRPSNAGLDSDPNLTPALQVGREDSGDLSPSRKRISRACDACNNLRTKCDGGLPCSHCTEISIGCTYLRERKKRGKASRKDIAAQQAAQEAASEQRPQDMLVSSHPPTTLSTPHYTAMEPNLHAQHSNKRQRTDPNAVSSPASFDSPHNRVDAHENPMVTRAPVDYQYANRFDHNPLFPPLTSNSRLNSANHHYSQDAGQQDYPRGQTTSTTPSGYSNGIDTAQQQQYPMNDSRPQLQTQYSSYNSVANTNQYSLPSPTSQSGAPQSGPYTTVSGSPMYTGVMGQSPISGGRLELPSPRGTQGLDQPVNRTNQWLRYPVLMPILPRITAIIPVSLACDLLDVYFASLTPACTQPASPYILAFPLRKRSVLRASDPRRCSKALLVTMLWVGAHTSESPFLTSPPSQRAKVCNQLLELSISLLNPLVHVPTQQSQLGSRSNSSVPGVSPNNFGAGAHIAARPDESAGPIAGHVTLDDVITYLTIATVVSASEFKAASLRWWTAAFSIARELKLGREMSPDDPTLPRPTHDESLDAENDGSMYGQSEGLTEESREERRRTWWLLYSVDRHISLCYNRPLSLRDAECNELLQPELDVVFQAGEHYPADPHASTSHRRKGPHVDCTGHGMFGFFLPLMTVLGYIVDLNFAKQHPIYGALFSDSPEPRKHAENVTNKLYQYAESLQRFEAQAIAQNPGAIEADDQTKTVVAYGTHLMHTLHIILNGKWDPISLLDDNDLWISTDSFLSATGHAVSAAQAIKNILEYDPDLSFMPFFFGIYLLQGSFLLLLIADKLRDQAAPDMVKACETVVRAHEVCVVTLNTEYQRNFRNVMLSALAQVKGRRVEDDETQEKRRREVLSLYRWTGDGTGLAL